MGSCDFKMLSLNVRGLSNFKKRRSIFTWCRKQNANIIFLQETHSTCDKEKQWEAEWGAPLELAHGSSNARGVAILLQNSFDCKIKQKYVDPAGRYIGIQAQINDENFYLFKVYGPNNDNQAAQFYDHLLAVLKKEDLAYEDKIIIGGDFNCPLNPMLDKQGGIITTRKKIVERFEEIIMTFNLHDIWRVKNPKIKSFTWCQKSPFIFCRLDYWLISDTLQDLIKNVDIIAALKTDHSAIVLHLQGFEESKKGPGFWKMNTSLLSDENFIQLMKTNLEIWKEEGKEFSDKRVAWDWIKYKVRLFSMQYSKELAGTKREKEESLQKIFQAAQVQFQQNPCEEFEKILDKCKTELEKFYDEKANGLIVRSRARWHEHGEKSTKYFLSLEKRNHTRKHIRKLCLSGVITTNHQKLLDSSSNYYKNLYSRKINTVQHDKLNLFLGQASIPKLSEEERLSCEGRITIDECVKALDSFENGKTPGNDGIPAEFYKTFWSSVGELMTDSFNCSFDAGEMSNSQKEAIITLIDKKGKDRMYLENWRPISLVNVDSKLASKVIANRIKTVLPQIIHHNQSGFIEGRFIGEVARSILDIIDYTESFKLPGILLFIDFKKAFDSIEWGFLFQSLEAFNFWSDPDKMD